MGWTATESLNTDVNYILIALKGRMRMFKSIFGDGSSKPENPPPDKSQIMTFVKTHNALYHAGRLRGVKPPKKDG